MMKTDKKEKKKVLLFIALGIVAVLAVAGVCVMIFLPVSYTVDKSLIMKNPDYNVYVTEKDGYTSLIKKDGNNSAGEEFKIIGFTDVHLDTKKEKGDVTMEYVIRNIVNEKPDMVVFVGDNITSVFNRRRAKQLANIMEELGVYWDFVLGNHEGCTYSITRKQMVKLFSKYPHCLMNAEPTKTKAGEKVWGNGNHVINLLDRDENIVRSLYFIDGGSDMTKEDKSKYASELPDVNEDYYDYIKESQIEWYSETVEDINRAAGKNVKSTIFCHIPLNEYKTAYEALTGETEVTQNVPKHNVKNSDGDFILLGQRRENICCPGHNSGMFDEMLKGGSTDSFICGHDHINDFALSYKGILLAYNEPSGYSSYNLVSKKLSDKLMQGFTRYFVDTDGNLSLEHVHNADLYPEAQEKIINLYK